MKICFLTSQLNNLNGWGSYSVGLISALQKLGISCSVLTPVNSNQEIIEVENHKILPPLFCPRWQKILYLMRFYFLIKKIINNCDLVHCQVEPLALLCRLTERPYFITVHGTHIFSSLQNQILKERYLKIYTKANKIFCVSQYTQKEFLNSVSLTNTAAINNGVDIKRFENLPIKRSNKEKIILSVGVIRFRKGYHISIPAFARASKKIGNLKYYIVGSSTDDGYFNQLKCLIKKLELEDKVKFFINITEAELLKLYSQAHLFVLTPVNQGGNFEGFGLVYLEAGAMGLPVIGTFNCGAQEAIQDGYNGLLVKQGDIAATTQAITKILENNKLAEKLGENGLKKAKDSSWDNVSKIYFNFFKADFNRL